MRILHYSLGFPPYRSGGLTKFCLDLMIEQKNEGDEVALLWPGQMGFIDKKIKIKKRSEYLASKQKIMSFELINPLPISFDEGIRNFDKFTLKGNKDVFFDFLTSFQPDVIHLHTLMGIHKEFLEVAKSLNIKLVFTAHDFFPICPKVTLFRNGKICDSVGNCKKCASCNSTALSINKIQILQSPIYRILKDSILVKKMRKAHRDNYLSEETADNSNKVIGNPFDYKKLRKYYSDILQMMDTIHYNSSITKMVYEKFYTLPSNTIIPVTHCDINDNRVIKNFNHKILRIRYLGPASKAKGYYLLKDSLDMLWKKRKDFILDIHFQPTEKSEYMKIHDRYNYNELKDIFNMTDILVVPSIWYETFGFTAAEALSYGVPVIVSENVGAKDVLDNQFGIIINDFNESNLKKCIDSLTMQDLADMNKNICRSYEPYTIVQMTKDIVNKCYLPRGD
ncbi:glycosyltransferase [Holdemanella porci]|uniref:glycosyltransferase n=1 Tax=Holdemanella porci TaxID=2652276 RepID=UPI00388FC377